jgi:hypothetical protein
MLITITSLPTPVQHFVCLVIVIIKLSWVQTLQGKQREGKRERGKKRGKRHLREALPCSTHGDELVLGVDVAHHP